VNGIAAGGLRPAGGDHPSLAFGEGCRAMTDRPGSTPLVPFNTFVVKVASRCNLNCSYCYMYNLADQTYRDQPATMSPAVTEAMARRIADHAFRHSVPWVHLILHGGEPLLIGKRRLRSWVGQVREQARGRVAVAFSMQSNGALIDDEWIDLLAELRVNIGISIDGPRRFHDRFRLDHHGRGSFDDVVDAIRRMRTHPRGGEIFSSLMGVVNPEIPPVELFDFWQSLDVPGFDLSLPHANHAHPPPFPPAAYGRWMIEFFDLWFDQNRPDRSIRYFENMLRMLFGYPISTDNIGGKPVGVVVVETDGSIEPTDAFKCCDDGITKLGLNVLRDDFDALYAFPMVNTLQGGAAMLCETCQSCEMRDVCGGGYMPHRFSLARRFDNPSVYCEALTELIRHIRARTVAALPADLRSSLDGRPHAQ
jgi:uncharacterized protein